MDDVAAAAGVSRALVSLVMRNAPNVSDKRRTAVLSAAVELGYRPNVAARSLAERRSNTLGVVVNDLHNTFFADVIDGIRDAAQARGYRLLLNTSWRTDTDEQGAVEAFLEYRVDAILVLGARASPTVLLAASQDTPLVTIGTSVDDVDAVVTDDLRGGELVAEFLFDLGHRDIAHIDGGRGAGAAQRREGFELAMRARGLVPRVIDGDFTEQSGVDGVGRLLDSGAMPTAIFAANDLSAVGVIDTLMGAGLGVPEDISVVGYDNTYLARLRHIGLTTIHQPRFEMGRLGANTAFERLETGRRQAVCQVLTPELTIRNTTAPPPSADRQNVPA
jgi:DNA-binding LacI/PurR family transcriptional regulator